MTSRKHVGLGLPDCHDQDSDEIHDATAHDMLEWQTTTYIYNVPNQQSKCPRLLLCATCQWHPDFLLRLRLPLHLLSARPSPLLCCIARRRHASRFLGLSTMIGLELIDLAKQRPAWPTIPEQHKDRSSCLYWTGQYPRGADCWND